MTNCAPIVLVRHGHHKYLGNLLAGRMPGVHLSDEGHQQAARIAHALKDFPIPVVWSSPLSRALETAQPLARELGVNIMIEPAINELDFGRWTGVRFKELEPRSDWRAWNNERSKHRAPGGETLHAVQQRAWTALQGIHAGSHEGLTVAVTHCDTIRAVVLGVQGRSMDEVHTLDVEPGSLTLLARDDLGWTVRLTNATPASTAEYLEREGAAHRAAASSPIR